MLTITKRGRIWHLAGHIGGTRLRFSLGTPSRDTAEKARNKIETAILEGKDSQHWQELARVLPPDSFQKAAQVVGYSDKPQPDAATWDMLVRALDGEAKLRIMREKLQPSTYARYLMTIREFSHFLEPLDVSTLSSIKAPIIEDFKAWRLARVLSKKQARGGGGIDLDLAILHLVFAYAIRKDMLVKNPVTLEGDPGGRPGRGAQPFPAQKLSELRKSAGEDLLTLLVLRHTGLRGGDAVDLRWKEIERSTGGINRVTQKRRKRVWFALHTELLFALEAEYQRRRPDPDERVLLNPATGNPLSRPRLYERMKSLGKRSRSK